MTSKQRKRQGNLVPTLILCRNCIQYIYEGTKICPHCNVPAEQESEAYIKGNYRYFEAKKCIERILKKTNL